VGTVETVRGQRDTGGLGATLMHEHIVAVSAALANDRPELSFPDGKPATIDKLVAELQELKNLGIDTVVDLTVFGHDRDVPTLVEINQRVDLNIVVATGFYTDNESSKTFQVRNRTSQASGVNGYADIFRRDITDGIAGTGVKAGIIKCVTDRAGFTDDVTEILRGCAIAGNDTGVPISTHSHPADRNGIDQLNFFRGEGVDLTRVIVGHSGDTDDLDYLKQLMDTGATIGSDRFGLTMPGTPDNDTRVQVIATLCEQGYADRIVVSHDSMMHTDWFAGANVLKQSQPNWRIAYIAEYVLPALRKAGVSDEHRHAIMVGNPARLLALRTS
jgi:phosphotriesterase-related protein